MSKRIRLTTSVVAVAILSFGLLAAACGNDDDDGIIDDTFGDDTAMATPTSPGVGDDGLTDDGLTDDGIDDVFNGDNDELTIAPTALEPTSLTVTSGSSITVVNNDMQAHTVMVDAEEEGEVDAGDSLDITFDEPGSYEITTDLHTQPVMVIVS